jgi:class 3 adenylate cyclase
MKRSLFHVNRLLRNELGLTVDMGISVHTGDVVVGNIGFEKKMDYTVIGDAVNIVFRLQGVAKSFPNGILVSETTLRAAQCRGLVHAVPVAYECLRELGDLKVFELLEPETIDGRSDLCKA